MNLVLPIPGGLLEVGAASRNLKEHLRRIGVEAQVLRRVMIAAYEAEANVAIHARHGTLFARLTDGRVDLEIVDEGPGIPDVKLALTAGWSTASEEARQLGFGAGLGLPNIRKSSDMFEIETVPGKGTRIHATIRLTAGSSPEERKACPPLVHADRCTRCLACVRACPVEALRLGAAGPAVLDHLCVGCGVCLATCPRGVFDLPGVEPPEAAVGAVLVAPAVVASPYLSALRGAGFAAHRALEPWVEAVIAGATATARVSPSRPIIPPTCDAVVHLVESAFPALIPNLLPAQTPLVAACRGLDLIPVTAAAGCPAQAAALAGPEGTARVRVCTAAHLASAARAGAHPPAVSRPVSTASSPVPTSVPTPAGVLRVEGMRRVLRMLAAAERGHLPDVEVLDLRACPGGCAGSPVSGGDPALLEYRATRAASAPGGGEGAVVERAHPFAPRRGVRLDPDMSRAMEKLARIDTVSRTLPGRDCAQCGSPTCAAHAEDVVLARPVGACLWATGGTT